MIYFSKNTISLTNETYCSEFIESINDDSIDTNNNSNNSSKNNSLSTESLIAIIIGSFFGFIVLLIIFFYIFGYFCFHKQNKSIEASTTNNPLV